MNIKETVDDLSAQYNVVSVIDLNYWFSEPYETCKNQLLESLHNIYQSAYSDNQRIVFTQTHDVSVGSKSLVLSNLLLALNEVDISMFFVIVVSTNPDISVQVQQLAYMNTDLKQLTTIIAQEKFEVKILDRLPYSLKEIYRYGSSNPIKINLESLTQKERFLLTESKRFCMYPWVHLHAWPTGQAFPCCMSDSIGQIGDCRTHSLKEIWNSPAQRQLRLNMLSETSSAACNRCYEQEESGFFSGRRSANKHHGHHVDRVLGTGADGTVDQFEMTYWDVRFSNLCNLKCRSCGHIFSSSWYQDQAQLAGGDWAKHNQVLNIAGRSEKDMWQQLLPHLDHVEQIYFAGGEPLMMEEHYLILEELERRGRFDVRLIYNTNFTHTKLKKRSVFDYWRKFSSVAVGASLDAMGPRAEYIRKGTVWHTVEHNRREMMSVCPDVDFYISPTLSIMNALHLPEFHRSWVEQGLIRPQDLNVNILQDPAYYRIDIATPAYKQQVQAAFEQHLAWLRPLDQLNRATVGFESAVTFMNATDNQQLLPKFWSKTRELDAIRNENILATIPELDQLL